jgi:hypothetical protein
MKINIHLLIVVSCQSNFLANKAIIGIETIKRLQIIFKTIKIGRSIMEGQWEKVKKNCKKSNAAKIK